MENLLWLLAGVGLIVAGYPLMTRRVPPNYWYGFRVPKTLRDPHVWYDANYVAGRDLLLAGLAVLLTALFTLLLAWLLPVGIASHLTYSVFIVAMLLVIVDGFWALSKL
ncbi:hypothetical protein C2W62_06700 [Candidatus Entotheonella serta]|nr:hypothetical protein C2W62_06700 [Candidatus Entotheonella serta]